MGQELDTLSESLGTASSSLGYLKTGLKGLRTAVNTVDKALDKIQAAIDASENLDDFVKNMESALGVLQFFPPIKSIVKLAKEVVEQARDRTAAYTTKLKDLEGSIKDYKADLDTWKGKLTDAIDNTTDAQTAVKLAKLKVDQVREVVDLFGEDAPPAALAAEARLETYAGQLNSDLSDFLNTSFGSTNLSAIADALSADIQSMKVSLGDLPDLPDSLAKITTAFRNVLSKVKVIDGPLDTLLSVLSPVTWVLEKAAWLIDKILDPIIDPILDATGVTKLINSLADKIAGLLPDLNLIPSFASFEAKIDALLAQENVLLDAFDLSAFFDEAGSFLSAFEKPATEGDDIFFGDTVFAGNLGGVVGYVFDGLGGDDIIRGAVGDDLLSGGGGADVIIASGGMDTIDGGAGDGDVLALKGLLIDYSLTFEEVVPGTWDFFLSYIGSDARFAGSMDVTGIEEFIFGGTSISASVLANAKAINYADGNTSLFGDSTNQLLVGANLADSVAGGGGSDTIIGNAERDTIDGGTGIDTVNYAAEPSASRWILLDPTHPDYATSDDVLISIENVVGGAGEDRIFGDDNANRLSGGGASDYIFGFGGNDLIIGGDGFDYALWGGDGDDTLIGGAKTDVFFGGRGTDLYDDLDEAANNILLYGRDSSGLWGLLTDFVPNAMEEMPDRIVVNFGGDLISTVEKYYGNAISYDTLKGAFSVYGTASDDVFNFSTGISIGEGEDGDDLFIGITPDPDNPLSEFAFTRGLGGAGADTLHSWTGDEEFAGHDGDDLVTLSIEFGVDAGPERDDIFDAQGNVIENAGARATLMEGDDGWDSLDLRGSDLNWSFVMTDEQTGWGSRLVTSTDIGPGRDDLFTTSEGVVQPWNFTSFNSIDDFDHHDLFHIDGWEHILGSEQSETFFIRDDRAATYNFDLHFEGNGGNDYLHAWESTRGIHAEMGQGDDEVIGSRGIDTVTGGAGNERLWAVTNAFGGTEVWDAGDGNDYVAVFDPSGGNALMDLQGGLGDDLLDFSAISGTMTIDISTGKFYTNGSDGDFAGFEAVIGGTSSNQIFGDDGDNVISGGRQQDIIRAGGGNDVVYSGTYPILFNTYAQPIDVDAGTGSDLVYLSGGEGVVDGGDGLDTVRLAGILDYSVETGFATNYDSRVFDGLDVIYLGFEWTVDVGTGDAIQQADVDYLGYPMVSRTGGVTLLNFERFIGGLGNDHFTAADANELGEGSNIDGSEGDDTLIGGTGVDTLAGGTGNDWIEGGLGDDILTPGGGADYVDGGDGHDEMDLRFGAQSITVDAVRGWATFQFNDDFSLKPRALPSTYEASVDFRNVEEFTLGNAADVFLGSKRDEIVSGGEGDDLLEGGSGSDTLLGGLGADTITGGGGGVTTWPDMIAMNEDVARNDYLTSFGNISLPSSELTIEMMFNGAYPGPGEDQAIFSYAIGDGAAANEFLLFATDDPYGNNGDFQFRMIANGAYYDSGVSVASLFDGTDHRLSVTFNAASGGLGIYVDGVLLVNVAPASLIGSIGGNGRLIIGQDQDTFGGGFQPSQALLGAVGDIRIYDTALDPITILNNVNFAVPDPDADPNLVHYWTVDAVKQKIVTVKGDVDLVGVGTSNWITGPEIGVAGLPGDDHLEGGDGDDLLMGAGVLLDAVQLSGKSGDDLLQGGMGDDTLLGFAGTDVLIGELHFQLSSDDVLDGGTGDDFLEGGGGSDQFVFALGGGQDTIGRLAVDEANLALTTVVGRDFEVGVDQISFVGFGFTSGAEIHAQFSDVGGHATFQNGADVLTIWGVTTAHLDAEDFVY